MFSARQVAGVVSLGLLVVTVASSQALANRYESPNYTIDASVGNSFGGDTTSSNYSMTSSGGESIIGSGAGGSYLLDQGYVAQLVDEPYLELSLSGPVQFGLVTPGAPVNASTTANVDTNTSAYSLALSTPDGLEAGTRQIQSIAAPVSSPVAWADGTTLGWGFSVASGPAADAKWQNGTRYAGVPSLDTTIYSQSLSGPIGQEAIEVKFRIDVAQSQAAAQYGGLLDFTATATP